jgi:hypothetical protein
VLAYAAPNWHEIKGGLKKLSKVLTSVQNKCLQIISGAYKATPARYLESEMAILPLDLYFDKWVANFEDYTEVSGMAKLLRAAGAKAAELATNRPGNQSRRRRAIIAQMTRDKRSQIVRKWKNSGRNNENIMVNKWGDRWKAAMARNKRGVFAIKRRPNLDNYKIYRDMPKHKALILMQARTKYVEMAEFLFRRHISDVLSPLYNCGKAPETPEHVLLYCPETEENRQNTRKKIAFIALRIRRNLAQLSTKHPKLITK